MIVIWIVIALFAAGDAAGLPDHPKDPPATASVGTPPEAAP